VGHALNVEKKIPTNHDQKNQVVGEKALDSLDTKKTVDDPTMRGLGGWGVGGPPPQTKPKTTETCLRWRCK